MLIGISYLPTENITHLLELIKTCGYIVLEGDDFNTIKTKKKKILEDNPDQIIFWNEPLLYENFEFNKVDKVLSVISTKVLLTDEEKKIQKNRNKMVRNCYFINVPEKNRLIKNGKFDYHLDLMKKQFKSFIKSWNLEKSGNFLTDNEISEVALGLIESHKLEYSLELHGILLSYLGNCSQKNRKIRLNPIFIRKNRFSKEDVIIITTHEMGHAVQLNLSKLEKKKELVKERLKKATTIEEVEECFEEIIQLVLEMENEAFDLSYQFLPKGFNVSLVEKYRKETDESYKSMYNKKKEKTLKKLALI